VLARARERAGKVGGADRGDRGRPGVGTRAGAGGLGFEELAAAGDGGLVERVADGLFIKVLVGTDGLLHVGDVQDALGAVRAFLVGGDTDEENADEAEKNGDHEGDFDKGEAGLLLDVVQFHYLY